MIDNLPTLTFKMVQLGRRETPWDLRDLLYKGGAACRTDQAANLIAAGEFGVAIPERVGLVQRLHEQIEADLTAGGSRHTASTIIRNLRYFFRWADAANEHIELEIIETVYLHWADHMLNRVRIKKDIKANSAYSMANCVGGLLDKILDRSYHIVCSTRLRKPPERKRVRGVASDKQNLTETFEYGHALLDIVDDLPVEAIWGPLPVRIKFRNGQELEEWSGLPAPARLGRPIPKNRQQRYKAKESRRIRDEYENDRTLRTRYPLINLRVEAELLIFIGQTGLNLAQAHKLKLRHYSYKSTIDGYEVRDYKNRRNGEVLFEIFSVYKEVFERYLIWRKTIFRDKTEGLLFPLIRRGGRAEDKAPTFDRVRNTCRKLGLRFIPASELRKTRINWLLRRSNDPDLTAELAQHSKKVLLEVYEEPTLQRSIAEITRFWQLQDPALPSPAPGVCDGIPVPVIDIPPEAQKPDCVRPTGCLWCAHHRDIDSLDYIWSVASMRHLKALALNGFSCWREGRSKMIYHLELAIERLTAKLRWFRTSNELRNSWVVESLTRIDEGVYHPHWQYLIVAMEGD
jgi:hypothetical protein